MTKTSQSVEEGHNSHQERRKSGVYSTQIQQLQQDKPSRRLSNAFFWDHVYEDLSLDGDIGDKYFGHRVSISSDGTIIAVSGICTNSISKTFFSKVRIFIENKNTEHWDQHGQDITSSNESEFYTDARTDVSLSGNGTKIAIASVYQNQRLNVGILTSKAEIKVYGYDSSKNWTEIVKPYEGEAGNGGSLIGLTVSLNGDGTTLAYGELYHDNATAVKSDAGKVSVCAIGGIVGSSTCDEVATGDAGDLAGTSVIIADNYPCLIYGSSRANGTNGEDSGTATVLCEANGNWTGGDWQQRQALHGEAASDEFGFSVGITSDAEYIAVGARFNDHTVDDKYKKDAGHVRVYKLNTTTTQYDQIGLDIDGERGENEIGINMYYDGDHSGSSIGLSDPDDNNIIKVAIGAPNNKGCSDPDCYYGYGGHMRIYQCNASACIWKQINEDIDGNDKADKAVGQSVAMRNDGLRVIVGVPEYQELSGDDSGFYIGRARVYEIKEEEATRLPSNLPSEKPSYSPSTFPTTTPTIEESLNPSFEPSGLNSNLPSELPSFSPSSFPTTTSTVEESLEPSLNPSSSFPTTTPRLKEALNPSLKPSALPSNMPSEKPSFSPSSFLTTTQTINESSGPSLKPSLSPSSIPTIEPTSLTSSKPSSLPSKSPSIAPIKSVSSVPSALPSDLPSEKPSFSPCSFPTTTPTLEESLAPSLKPSLSRSYIPTIEPMSLTSSTPSALPSKSPSIAPTKSVSSVPSALPSDLPSEKPLFSPSSFPTTIPTVEESLNPSLKPSALPSNLPSELPLFSPSSFSTSIPTHVLTSNPSLNPSLKPSLSPSSIRATEPTSVSSSRPSSFLPSESPSIATTGAPSALMSIGPSEKASLQPSVQVTTLPSAQPITHLSDYPSTSPSDQPTMIPSLSTIPTARASDVPSLSSRPSVVTSGVPSLSNKPSIIPSVVPSLSTIPSAAPSEASSLSNTPSSVPSGAPSLSIRPSLAPSEALSSIPSAAFRDVPSFSSKPSTAPSEMPSLSDNYFQIHSKYSKFDSSLKWCATNDDGTIGDGGKILMRPCKSRSHRQVFFQNEFGEIQFIEGPRGAGNPNCIHTAKSTVVHPDSCFFSGATNATIWDISTTNTDGSIQLYKNNKVYLLGFDTSRKYSRLRLFKKGSYNGSLNEWFLNYGYKQPMWQEPAYGNFLYLENQGALTFNNYLSDTTNVTPADLSSIIMFRSYIGYNSDRFEWIIRSKVVDVFDSSVVIDPKFGDCLQYGDTIYLQGNKRSAVFLKNDATVDRLSAESERDFEWIVQSTDTLPDTLNGTCVAANNVIYLKSSDGKFLYIDADDSSVNVGSSVSYGGDYHKWSTQREPFLLT